MLYLQVTYHTKPGAASDFLCAVFDADIPARTRKEAGNCRYDFCLPADVPDTIVLLEEWETEKSIISHRTQPHFLELGKIKDSYVLTTDILRLCPEV